MTAFDMSGILFVYFDAETSENQALRQIDFEIRMSCEEEVKVLKKLKDECEELHYPDFALVTDEDIAQARKQRMVYSPQTVDEAIRRIEEKRLNAKSEKERRAIIHQSAVEYDKMRIEARPNKCYALCKENEGNPLALKRPEKSEVELKHERMMRNLEKEIKEGKYSDDGMEKEAEKVQDAASVHRGNPVWKDDDKSDWCALNDGSNPEFCIFDLLA